MKKFTFAKKSKLMNQEALKTLCLESCEIIKEVGNFIRAELGKVKANAIEVKALNSLVSYVDKEAETQLVKGLGALLPAATFLTEEETVKSEKGTYQWIIDPLDGTTNFLHQLPFFSVSVALQHEEQTVIGIVYEVNQKECFYAWKDGGAFLNEKSIQVTRTANLADTLIATGFPYYDYESIKAYLQVLEILMQNTRGIRRFGSAALDLAYVSCGRFDAFFEYSLNAWDVAAGILLVQEAGGKVTDFKGGSDYLFGKELIASNTGVSEEIFRIIHHKFYPDS
jgi:myo-inositol-1(or 4)-monophosphatase